MKFGYCANMIAKDAMGIGYERIPLIKRLGFDYVELPLAQIMTANESAFREKMLTPLEANGLPCECMNNFFPSSFRLSGPDANEKEALEYAKCALTRANRLGAHTVVFGSAAARNTPLGFSRAEGHKQLQSLLHKLAPLAKALEITIAIEPLNRMESNVLNTFEEALALCHSVNHPNIRVLFDLYHFRLSESAFCGLLEAGPLLRHVHLARALGRTMPTQGDGEPYETLFHHLASINYRGNISIEAYTDHFEREALTALSLLKQLSSPHFS